VVRREGVSKSLAEKTRKIEKGKWRKSTQEGIRKILGICKGKDAPQQEKKNNPLHKKESPEHFKGGTERKQKTEKRVKKGTPELGLNTKK